MYLSFVLWDKYRDGSLQTMAQFAFEYVTSKMKEHIFEPISKLGKQ